MTAEQVDGLRTRFKRISNVRTIAGGMPLISGPRFPRRNVSDMSQKLMLTCDQLLILATGLEDNLCHRYCACDLPSKGKKDCIQERAAAVLRAIASEQFIFPNAERKKGGI